MYSTSCSVIWITGLSGTGKTTIAGIVVDKLRARGLNVIQLDGDSLRGTLPPVCLGFDRKNRLALARFYSDLAGLLSRQGFVVVVSTISLFHEIHARNRAAFGTYLEVLLDAPREAIRSEEELGNNALAPNAPIVGINIEPEMPEGQDTLILRTHEGQGAEACADLIVAEFHDCKSG